jgi:hypothetical protein
MDREDQDLPNRIPDRDRPSLSSDAHRHRALLVHHLEEVLSLYDALNEGDGESAANAQRSLNEAKKILRAGLHASRSLPTPPASATILPFPAASLAPKPDAGDE